MKLLVQPIVLRCDVCGSVSPVFYEGDVRPADSWLPTGWATRQVVGEDDQHLCKRCLDDEAQTPSAWREEQTP